MSFKVKSEIVTFRVDKDKYKILEKLADLEGLKISRFMDEKVLVAYFKSALRKITKESNARS